MKRVLSIFLLLMMTNGALAACQKGGNNDSTSTSSMSSSSTSESSSTSSSTSDSSSDSSEESSSSSSDAVVTSLTLNAGQTDYFAGEVVDTSKISVVLTKSDDTNVSIAYSNFLEKGIVLKFYNSSSEEVNIAEPLSIGSYSLEAYLYADSNIKDYVSITVVEEVITLGDESLEGLTDSFDVSQGTYTSTNYRSVKIFEDGFDNGTLQATIAYNGSGYDNFLVFAYDQVGKSYYSYGFNMRNKLQITYFDGAKLSLVKVIDKAFNNSARLSIELDGESGAVNYYCDGAFVFEDNIAINHSLKYGIYAGSIGCSFSNIDKSDDNALIDSDFSRYVTANGTINLENNIVVAQSNSVLTYHPTKTFKHGEMGVTYNAKNVTGNVGMAFCIDSNGRTSFYRESDVTYYYLCVTIGGTIGLYRVKDSTAILLKNLNLKEYYRDRDHEMKIIRDSNDTIHAFLDDALCFSYVDRHPLKGDKYGLSSTVSGTVYSKIYAKKTFGSKEGNMDDYQVTSGSFYKCGDMIVSSANNSMLIKKQEGAANGTITAEVTMGQGYGTGLVFKLTKPESQTFYQDEARLSYYWLDVKSNNRIIFGKFNSGSVTWTIEKYLPYFMTNGTVMRVVMDGNDIYAYCSGVLAFHYHDDNPLSGKYYGFRSDSKGASILGDINFTENRTHDTTKYLIFGHSYTQLWHRYKEDFADLNDDIMDIGIGGSQTRNWADQYAHETACYNPEWGIYWNGINDIDADIASSTIMGYYQNCLESIKSELPNFKCVVLSVSRCTHEKPMARLENISEVNELLRAYCETKDWLVYVDVETIFCDSSGNPIDSYFVDKLHPTAEGYKLVAPLVVDAIKNYGN